MDFRSGENTEATLDAALAMVRARDPAEAALLQAKFIQTQITKSGQQGKELYELASKQIQQTFASWNGVATKSRPRFNLIRNPTERPCGFRT